MCLIVLISDLLVVYKPLVSNNLMSPIFACRICVICYEKRDHWECIDGSMMSNLHSTKFDGVVLKYTCISDSVCITGTNIAWVYMYSTLLHTMQQGAY